MLVRLRASGRSRFDHLAALEQRLDAARVVEPGAIPDDVVTLNTRVRLRNLATRRRMEVVLADPVNIALFGDQMSVAGPCGAALLGRRSGDVVTWTLGGRETAYLVERVLYQPEAAGDFHL
jgi:regulator of nucleoside diphosphate kinase